MMEEIKQLKAENATTIERCAQVAEKCAEDASANSFYMKVATEIAAAIRALKDKPTTDPNIINPGKDLTNVFPEEEP